MSRVDTKELRGEVAVLVRQGYSASMIAKEVGISLGRAKDWKRDCLKDEKLFKTGPHYSTAGNPKFSERERTHMATYMEEHEVSARSAATLLSGGRETGGKAVSRFALARLARKAGLSPYTPPTRPDLEPEHKRERFIY